MLLQPDAADALSRAILLWTLYAYQPDYLALTALSPLYSEDPRADDWFRDAYRAIQRFDDPRFWVAPWFSISARQHEWRYPWLRFLIWEGLSPSALEMPLS